MPESPAPQITVTPLPALPDPHVFTAHSGPSTFLIQEARRAYDQLASLRQTIIDESSNYSLDPPGPSSLPPLPPVPLPPTSYRRTSVHSASSTSPKPVIRPGIPLSSPFAKTSTLDSCLDAFRTSEFEAQARYGDTAVWADMGQIRAWVILREQNECPIGVRSIRIYASSEGERPIHCQSSSAPHRALSKHLTDLQLSLPELLYRLAALPSILASPCHFCSAHLREPDGLPYGRTGYIAPADPDPTESSPGKWVSWHPSCEPFP